MDSLGEDAREKAKARWKAAREKEQEDRAFAIQVHERSIQEANDEQVARELQKQEEIQLQQEQKEHEQQAEQRILTPQRELDETFPASWGWTSQNQQQQHHQSLQELSTSPPRIHHPPPPPPLPPRGMETDEDMAKRLQLEEWQREREKERQEYFQRQQQRNRTQPYGREVNQFPRRNRIVFERIISFNGGSSSGSSEDGDENLSYEQLLELEERIGNAKETGASDETINSLPTFTFKPPPPQQQQQQQQQASTSPKPKNNEDEKEKDCVICQDEFKEGDEIRVLPCMHRFHQNCIDIWLKTKKICPVCRASI